MTQSDARAVPPLAVRCRVGVVLQEDRAVQAVAQAILARAATYLGVGLANYINIFNPEAIVIGGGVTRIGRRFLEPAFALARSRAFRLPSERVRLVPAALEGRSEVLGVSALARDSI